MAADIPHVLYDPKFSEEEFFRKATTTKGDDQSELLNRQSLERHKARKAQQQAPPADPRGEEISLTSILNG